MSWRKISGKELITSGQQNKLEVKNAVFSDSGKYVCAATDISGKVQQEAKLFVEGTMNAFLMITILSYFISFHSVFT